MRTAEGVIVELLLVDWKTTTKRCNICDLCDIYQLLSAENSHTYEKTKISRRFRSPMVASQKVMYKTDLIAD